MSQLRKIVPINVGGVERIIRVVAGAGLLYVSYSDMLPESYVLWTVFAGGLGVLSGLSGSCPIFHAFNVDTSGKKS